MKNSLLTLLLVATVSTVANAAPVSTVSQLASEAPRKKPLMCDSAEVRIGASSKACDILARRLVGVEWTHAVMTDTGNDTAVLLLSRVSGVLRCRVVMRQDVLPTCEDLGKH